MGDQGKNKRKSHTGGRTQWGVGQLQDQLQAREPGGEDCAQSWRVPAGLGPGVGGSARGPGESGGQSLDTPHYPRVRGAKDPNPEPRSDGQTDRGASRPTWGAGCGVPGPPGHHDRGGRRAQGPAPRAPPNRLGTAARAPRRVPARFLSEPAFVPLPARRGGRVRRGHPPPPAPAGAGLTHAPSGPDRDRGVGGLAGGRTHLRPTQLRRVPLAAPRSNFTASGPPARRNPTRAAARVPPPALPLAGPPPGPAPPGRSRAAIGRRGHPFFSRTFPASRLG